MESGTGPGWCTPLEAMEKGPREKIMYVTCVQPNSTDEKSDFLATVDIDPDSPTYCKIIHRVYTGKANDELHHFGWNVCSSCNSDCNAPKRDKLILPCLGSDRIVIIDTGIDPKAPILHKIIDSCELHKLGCATPHTSHCLPSGNIMISILGDPEGNKKCDFVLIDEETLTVNGTWVKESTEIAKFGYDFWYQPYFNIMVSTEWAAPNVFKPGFNPADVPDIDKYGRNVNFFCWESQKLIKSVDLGLYGAAPLEVRFLHEPKQPQGYFGSAVYGSIYRFHKDICDIWQVDKTIEIPPLQVTGLPGSDLLYGFISDIIISMDDKYLYFSNWTHGDIRQYDITDPANPVLVGQLWLGGLVLSDSSIKVDDQNWEPKDPVYIGGKRLYGAPQMLQLSLDGKRLYITNSLYSTWDDQFYKEIATHGSYMVKVNVDVENGGLELDETFFVDFGDNPNGACRAHEMRYPLGDCSSDIYLAR